MTCPELRITAREAADCPRRDVACSHCRGRGMCYHGGAEDYPDPDWCCSCGGAAIESVPCMSAGASARLGALLVAAMPHLRHATWPPKRTAGGRATLAGMAAMAVRR